MHETAYVGEAGAERRRAARVVAAMGLTALDRGDADGARSLLLAAVAVLDDDGAR